jgi:hypothetical protein
VGRGYLGKIEFNLRNYPVDFSDLGQKRIAESKQAEYPRLFICYIRSKEGPRDLGDVAVVRIPKGSTLESAVSAVGELYKMYPDALAGRKMYTMIVRDALDFGRTIPGRFLSREAEEGLTTEETHHIIDEVKAELENKAPAAVGHNTRDSS